MGWFGLSGSRGRADDGGESETESAASTTAAATPASSEKTDEGTADLVPAPSEEEAEADDDETPKLPRTLDEVWAVLQGEGPIQPDYGRLSTTVFVGLGGGYMLGWREAASVAAKYPAHQQTLIKRRMAMGKGLKVAAFSLAYEGSVACLTALRQKKDFINGGIGGALAGTAFGVTGGLAKAGRGLFVGAWLGAVVDAFQNHLTDLKEDRLRYDMWRSRQKRADKARHKVDRANSLKSAIKSMDTALAGWEVPGEEKAKSESEPVEKPRRRRWWRFW